MSIAAVQKTVALKLEFPVDYQSATIAELKVRRPKGKDMRFLPKGEPGVEDMFPFFGLLCSVEEGVFDEMDAADLMKLGEVVEGFLAKGKKKTTR